MIFKIVMLLMAAQALYAAKQEFPGVEKSTKSGQMKSLTEIPFAAKTSTELVESKADFFRRQGVAALWLEDAVEAEKIKAMLSQNPADADLNYVYGAYLSRQGRKADALVYLTVAAEADPTTVLYQIEAGRAHVTLQSYFGAIRYFERANKLSFADIHRLNELGDTYAKAGKIEAAKKTYAESLRIFPNQPVISEKLKNFPS